MGRPKAADEFFVVIDMPRLLIETVSRYLRVPYKAPGAISSMARSAIASAHRDGEIVVPTASFWTRKPSGVCADFRDAVQTRSDRDPWSPSKVKVRSDRLGRILRDLAPPGLGVSLTVNHNSIVFAAIDRHLALETARAFQLRKAFIAEELQGLSGTQGTGSLNRQSQEIDRVLQLMGRLKHQYSRRDYWSAVLAMLIRAEILFGGEKMLNHGLENIELAGMVLAAHRAYCDRREELHLSAVA